MKKRILSLFLTVVMLLAMIVSAIPTGAASSDMPFVDVKAGKWYYKAIQRVYELGWMNGMDATHFAPNDPMTRGQFVTIIARISGKDYSGMASEAKFSDTTKKRFYSDALGWCVKNGIINGYPDGTFKPDNPILRQEFAAVFDRFLKLQNQEIIGTDIADKFKDESTFPKFAKTAIETLRKTGLVKGDDKGNFNPKNNMTRAEIAQVLARYADYLDSISQKSLEDLVEDMLDTYLCGAHSKLDLFFNYTGSSLTEENVGNLLKKLAGLPDTVTVEFDDFESMVEGYQGAGDGAGHYNNGWVWESDTVTFSDSATGETYTTDIDFSFRKCLALSLFDEYKNGVLGIDPDDANQTMKNAYGVLDGVTATKEEPYTGYTGEYTAEAIEAFFRELTGLTDKDSYGFLLPGFDPNTPGEPFWPMFQDLKNPDGRLDIVWIETVFAVPEKPLSEKIEDKLSDLLCGAHSRLDLEFGTS